VHPKPGSARKTPLPNNENGENLIAVEPLGGGGFKDGLGRISTEITMPCSGKRPSRFPQGKPEALLTKETMLVINTECACKGGPHPRGNEMWTSAQRSRVVYGLMRKIKFGQGNQQTERDWRGD